MDNVNLNWWVRGGDTVERKNYRLILPFNDASYYRQTIIIVWEGE